MKREPINIEYLEEWMADTWSLYASHPLGRSFLEGKVMLWVNSDRKFKVEVKGEIKLVTPFACKAVDLFNTYN